MKDFLDEVIARLEEMKGDELTPEEIELVRENLSLARLRMAEKNGNV